MNLERKMARWAIAASAALVFVGIGASPASSQQTAVRLGYINSDIVLQQTPGYAQADSILRTERTAYQRELDALRGQLDSAIAAFDQQSLVLSPQAREAKLDEIRTMQERAQQRANELQNRDLQRRQELVAPLESRIQSVIDGIRAERNLAVIFDVASPTTNIVSADPGLDLTSLVITRLRADSGQ